MSAGVAAADPAPSTDIPVTAMATAKARAGSMSLLGGGLGEQPRTRTAATAITAERLGDCWPDASRRLHGLLARRGVSPADAEDMVQECALRVLAHSPTYVDADDLLRWCLPVVRNLSVDGHRRGARQMATADVPDLPTTVDLHEHVEHRAELARVLRGIAQLSRHDREAIVAAIHDDHPQPVDRREAVKLNVRRHRARQRLTTLLGGLAAVLGWVGRRVSPAVQAAPAVLAAIVVAVAAGVGSSPGWPSAMGDATTARAGGHGASTARSNPPPPPEHRRPDAATLVPRAAVVPDRALTSRNVEAAAVQAPTGDRVIVTTSDERPSPGALVCAAGLPGLRNICITRPRSGPLGSSHGLGLGRPGDGGPAGAAVRSLP